VPLPLLETLSKIFNGNAVEGCQQFLLKVSKMPPLLAKNRMVDGSYPPYLFDLAPCDLFFILRNESGFEWKVFADTAEVQ